MVSVRALGYSMLVVFAGALAGAPSHAAGLALQSAPASFSELIGEPPEFHADGPPPSWSASWSGFVADANRDYEYLGNGVTWQFANAFDWERHSHGGGWFGEGNWGDRHCVQSPVPEPGITALSFAGLGAVVFLVRRRRQG